MSNILGNMPPVFGSGYRGVVPAPSAADVSAQNILRADGTWGATPSGAIPSQTGNATKLLTTDGTNASWSGAVTVSGSNATVGGNLTVSGTANISGNAAVGLGNATADLIIKSSVATGGAGYSEVLFGNTSTPTRGYLSYNHATDALLFGTGGATRSTLDGTGNLSLTGNFTVSGASYNNFTGALWLGTTAGYGTLNVGNVSGTGTATYSCLTIGDQSTPANATGLYMRGTSAVCGISTAGAPIAFFLGGPGLSEAARFFNNGNFGIGTGSTDGGQKLQVAGGAKFNFATNTNITLSGSGTISTIASLNDALNTYEPLFLNSSTTVFNTNGVEATRFDSSQNATFAGTGTSSFAGNLNIKGALGAHQTAALNLAYEGSSVSQLVAYGADASTLGRVNVILRKAGTGTDAVTGLSVRDFGIITQGGVAQTPASASATGAAGTIQWDASYIYICTATNTWKRVAIATW